LAPSATLLGLPNGITVTGSGSNTLAGIITDASGNATVSFSGTTQNSGTYKVSVVLSDNGGATLTKDFNLVVHDKTPLEITTVLPDAIAGQSYSQLMKASGGTGPYNWSTVSTTYPSGCCVLGLSGTTQTSTQYGMPDPVYFNTQSGSTVPSDHLGLYQWVIKVTDAIGQTSTKTLNLTIKLN
jgi:hypothetical protein